MMVSAEAIIEASTLRGFALAIGLWIAAKFTDALLQKFLGRKIFSPTVGYAKFRIQAALTRFEPIEAEYCLNYAPRDDYTIAEIKSELESVFKEIKRDSKGRITNEDIRWNGSEGRVEVKHSQANYEYEVLLTIVDSNDYGFNNSEENLEERKVEEVFFEIGFEFSYPKLDAELPNVGTFASKLESSLDSTFYGMASNPKIEFTPLDSELSLDQWIDREGFDVSLKLSGSPDDRAAKTEVEFYPDHIEVHPPYYEVDADVIRYIRILVRKYYMKNSSSGNVLNITSSKGRK